MSGTEALLDDLRAEGDELDGLVAGLDDAVWATPTPAPGWTIAHQIAHLTWTDERAAQAALDPEGFAAEVRKARAAPGGFVDEGADQGAAQAPGELLRRWRAGRERLRRTLAEAPPGTRLPWYGPPMSVKSMVTGRLMETWAHGQDIADALGVRRAPTARLRHVALIGVRARGYAYAARGLEAPAEEFRVELTAPDGDIWTFGPEDAAQRVTGPALDFCLLVTQRVHRDDVALQAEGPDADRWLDIAQAFAGPPGKGRLPGEGRLLGEGGPSGGGRLLGEGRPSGEDRSSGEGRPSDEGRSPGGGRLPGEGRPSGEDGLLGEGRAPAGGRGTGGAA